jgi:hypothetical protein
VNDSNGSSDTPPQSPLFKDAPGASPPTIPLDPWTSEERAQIDKLKQLIKDGKLGSKNDDGDRGRAQKFYPYLLTRSFTGDNGTRPFNQVFWESPDIWTAVGEPSATPEIPPTHGGVLPVGQPNTVYAHVWNLGRAPLTGVVVMFYWFNPSLAIDASHANLIGMTRIDLGPRNSPLCHQLVKCPKPWIPVMENGGHECLVVKVWGFGDGVASTEWNAWQDRHVAQRNVAVVQTLAQMKQIVSRFQLTAITRAAHFELVQVGAEAKDAVAIVAPKLTLDPKIATQTLANLDAANVLRVSPPNGHGPRILPHTLNAAAATPAGIAPSKQAMAATSTAATATITPEKLTVPGANVGTLVEHSALFNDTLLGKLHIAAPPPAGQAQVLRLVQYDGTQITGGYTLVVGNPG